MAEQELKETANLPKISDTGLDTAEDPTNASVTLIMEQISTGNLIVNDTGTIDDATQGDTDVSYQLSDSQSGNTGLMRYEWVITYSDGDDQYFPVGDNYFYTRIGEKLDTSGSVSESSARSGPIDILLFNEQTSDPSAPVTNDWGLYFQDDGNLYKIDENGTVTQVGGGTGSAITLDLGDDDSNESTDLQEIATTNDTNSIFSEPSADKLLIDASVNWPTADTVATVPAHATNHADGGSDELDAADLAGALGTSGQFLQSDGAAASWATAAFSDLNGTVSLAQLAEILDGNNDVEADHLAAGNLPGHASRHSDGGADELDVAELAGALGSADTVPLSDGAAVTWSTVPNAGLTNSAVTVTAGDGLKNGGAVSLGGSVSVDVEPTDFAGEGLFDDGTDDLEVEERYDYQGGGMTQWADGLTNEEVDRIGLQTGETLVIDRIEFRQKGGGSSASASVRVQDVTAASTVGSQTLGGTTKNPGSSGSGNTVLVQVSNSTGASIDASIRVIGRIQGA